LKISLKVVLKYDADSGLVLTRLVIEVIRKWHHILKTGFKMKYLKMHNILGWFCHKEHDRLNMIE